jgi:hypothetical protein
MKKLIEEDDNEENDEEDDNGTEKTITITIKVGQCSLCRPATYR